MTNKKTIGFGIEIPAKTEIEDINSPFHGELKVRGRSLVGTVVSDKMNKTVTVQWNRRIYVPKYERFMVKTSKVKAHNPPELDVKEGDIVRIMQCKPISKLKHFVVVEKMPEENSAETKSKTKK